MELPNQSQQNVVADLMGHPVNVDFLSEPLECENRGLKDLKAIFEFAAGPAPHSMNSGPTAPVSTRGQCGRIGED